MGTFPQDQQENFLEVLYAALSMFEGDTVRAREWILKPIKGLGGKTPARMTATRAETDLVLDFVRRLEHGFSA
ncbi:hypothetical protein BWR59_19630 [Pseudomonas sp. Bc-h]|uniref:antitoxin Xre/MbcA/ParS toxin-binding domain-containing protein n=1 Tax=Pseudomonas sp. Bc-h TaxID=1943632 RepID=UPI0009DAA4F2|nr:antitoxin Xre/MbcA/ParS toxin-binding domain-containing protein [Pseudomonas sp. Bc-h]OQR29679.1 hypothetical protein BWR59_19630 [Pseudomonas sp. Bc-h]